MASLVALISWGILSYAIILGGLFWVAHEPGWRGRGEEPVDLCQLREMRRENGSFINWRDFYRRENNQRGFHPGRRMYYNGSPEGHASGIRCLTPYEMWRTEQDLKAYPSLEQIKVAYPEDLSFWKRNLPQPKSRAQKEIREAIGKAMNGGE